MPVGDIYRVAIEGTCDGSQVVNTLHYEVISTGGEPGLEMDALANAVETDLVPRILALTSGDTRVENIQVRGVTNPILGHDLAVGAPGVRVGQRLPNQNSALILFGTGFIGRSYQGKLYFWPGMEEDVLGNVWEAAYVTNLNNFASDARNLEYSILTITYMFGLVVYSRKLGQATRVTSQFVVGGPRIQRRRRPGVGQ